MLRRTRTAMIVAAIAGLVIGLAGPAASASPITDLINSIGTGSAAPGAGAQATTQIRFQTRLSSDSRGYVVRRESSAEDACFTIRDLYSSRAVTTGLVIATYTVNAWKVDVDTTKPGCTAPLQTTVAFSNSSYGTPALLIEFGRDIYVSCDDQSASGRRACERTYGPPDGFDFEIR